MSYQVASLGERLKLKDMIERQVRKSKFGLFFFEQRLTLSLR